MRPTCNGCLFFNRGDVGALEAEHNNSGTCRRNAPQFCEDGDAYWPRVRIDYWCGEYSSLEEYNERQLGKESLCSSTRSESGSSGVPGTTESKPSKPSRRRSS